MKYKEALEKIQNCENSLTYYSDRKLIEYVKEIATQALSENNDGWVSNSLYVKEKLTGKVFKVWKYIESNDGEVSIWSNDWYGRHVIGNDCEFCNPPKHKSK